MKSRTTTPNHHQKIENNVKEKDQGKKVKVKKRKTKRKKPTNKQTSKHKINIRPMSAA
jgi:hypothetical protein